jgi:L-glyceraldehyde 3-phosphate reductase
LGRAIAIFFASIIFEKNCEICDANYLARKKRHPMPYLPATQRYDTMQYRRCGRSGLKLPAISLGLWHNFGHVDVAETFRKTLHLAFDAGITHFDLANNYGPPPGSAEENFGRILKQDFHGYRDEMIISTKAGYLMWEGPYGEWGSKKYLVASLDQSLRRMGLDYVDIFYSHRPDPDTPLEETMSALDLMVRQGKALYVGISSYQVEEAREAFRILKSLGTPCLIHQPKYSMFVRWVENGLLDLLEKEGVGCIPFSPLAQGLLTDKYLGGIPADSRAAKSHGALKESALKEETLRQIRALNEIAQRRGQTLAQMALAWLLKDTRVTSVLVGASKPEQLADSLKCLENLKFDKEELESIEGILK